MDMPRNRYLYTQREVTRHGKTVWYFRKGDGKRIRLKGEYGSQEFIASYSEALHNGIKPTKESVTLAWIIDEYQKSAMFRELKPSTQRMRSNILKRVKATAKGLLAREITRQTIAEGRDRRADTPFAAINFLKVMSYVFDWALDAEYVNINPVKGVKRPKAKTLGHKAWTDDDILKYYSTHAVGTKARLAMDMLLFTGLRRIDVCRIGPQHVRDGVIEYRTEKTAEPVYIRIHPTLKKSMDACVSGQLAFLVTETTNKPFASEAAFGNWFADQCVKAGVDGRAHGLRKKLAQLVAEAGGSNSELKAMFGWTSDAMANLYTRAANRKALSESGAARLNQNILDGDGK